MKATTVPRRRQAALRLARCRSSGTGPDAVPATELNSRHPARAGLLQGRVDLAVHVLQAFLEVSRMPGHVRSVERTEQILILGADDRDRGRRRVRVVED